MRVEALLCDAATVREGLLHVLGGGVSRLARGVSPGPLGAQLALMMTAMPIEASQGAHKFQITLQDEDGKSIMEITGQFMINPAPDQGKGEPMNLPLVLNLANVAIPKAGIYSLE